ncbi:MAG: hypothetical protein ACJ8MR_16460 [Povalibacter sp.]
MGLSETIVAAMIGATATVGTALFQLLMAFRARGKTDAKPKRGTGVRSILAVLALMAASAAGGFLYSQLLREREQDDIRGMRQELRELRDLTAQKMLAREEAQIESKPMMESTATVATSLEPVSGAAESIAYVPACRVVGSESAECAESDAQRIALCGTVPAEARVATIKFFAQADAVQQPWEQHAVTLESDLGGARFTGKTFEYAQGQGRKAVCVNFQQWSSAHPQIARILIEYEIGEAVGVPESSPQSSPQSSPIISAAPMLTPASISAEVQSRHSSDFGAAVR